MSKRELLKKVREKVFRRLAKKLGYILVRDGELYLDDRYLDRTEFRYILWIAYIYNRIRTVPGHIVEVGVAKGRNSILFSNLIDMHAERGIRKYYGFDTFLGYLEEDIEQDPRLSENRWKGKLSIDWVKERMVRVGFQDTCEFIAGDVVETAPKFLKENPDFRTALLYIDCSAYRPALGAMRAFRDFMSPGGIICIDQKVQGGEWKALHEFCKENNLRYQKDEAPFSPPAYTVVG